jgi:outer membrane protein
MKKNRLVLVAIFGFALAAHGQMAFVDTKYILNKMPAYQDSIAILNQLSAVWQKEIDDKQATLDKMYKDFEKDEAMLSDSVKKHRTDAIFLHEREVRDLQRMHFGFEGDLSRKKQELIKPLEDSVTAAIRRTATRLNYTIILDKSEGITVLYSKSNLDITDEVIKDLGN